MNARKKAPELPLDAPEAAPVVVPSDSLIALLSGPEEAGGFGHPRVPSDNPIALLSGLDAAAVYAKEGGVDAALAIVATHARAVVADVTTKSGREAIASNAYRVARSKTLLDDLGKSFVSDLKAKAGAVDAERRRIRETLDALKDEVRRPLTEMEEREAARVADIEARVADIVRLGENIDRLSLKALDERQFLLMQSHVAKEIFSEFFGRAEEAWQMANTRISEARAAEAERVRVAALSDKIADVVAIGRQLGILNDEALVAREMELQAMEGTLASEDWGDLWECASGAWTGAREAVSAELVRRKQAAAEAKAAADREAIAREAALRAELEEQRRRNELAQDRFRAEMDQALARQAAPLPEPPASMSSPLPPIAVAGTDVELRAFLWLASVLVDAGVPQHQAEALADMVIEKVSSGVAEGLRLADR